MSKVLVTFEMYHNNLLHIWSDFFIRRNPYIINQFGLKKKASPVSIMALIQRERHS